jgi:hypothetical protein
MGEGRYSVPESRAVRSVWAWRALLMMSMLAFGIALILFANRLDTFGILWLVIAGGWFGISMWLWKMHLDWEKSAD